MTYRIALRKVPYMPPSFEPGVLYVAEEFGAAAHLCACGCGVVIRTPLDETEWTLTETIDGPSLSPSIGNWQEACQSHYWIVRGEVVWAPKWTPKQIQAGRRREQAQRDRYYRDHASGSLTRAERAWKRFREFFGLD